jgi:hypothetical protein
MNESIKYFFKGCEVFLNVYVDDQKELEELKAKSEASLRKTLEILNGDFS